MRARPLADRLWSRVDATGPCWLWMGARSSSGYGSIHRSLHDGGEYVATHRAAWELLVGPIPDELELDHLCRVRHCCNPDHLELVTHAENMRRSGALLRIDEWQLAKTQCPQGHPYDDENTYRRPSGYRYCRACHREQERARARKAVS